jgi:hypothetical protein
LNIKGMDFTSVPSARKPITCVQAGLRGKVLSIGDALRLEDFSGFERVLDSRGPWIAGIDFPFGQSRRLVSNLRWPTSWEAYVGQVSSLSRDAFVRLLKDYKENRAPGDREHFRVVDRLARSKSPQKLYGVPVAKMFFEGAKRLLASPVSVVPLRPTSDARIVVEAYPALVVRRFIDRRSYKNDSRAKQTAALTVARRAIVEGLGSDQLRRDYGFEMRFSAKQAEQWIADATGDLLDSVLCTVQAAWAWTQRNHAYGIPENADPLEGWIADPGLLPLAGD